MNEMKYQELMNKNKCPAEYVNEVEGQSVPYDCEKNGYDCRTCVEGFIDEVKQEPLLEIEPYPEEFEYEDFCIALGTLIKERFRTGYVKCRAENMGWMGRSGYKVFTVDTTDPEDKLARIFLNQFTPNCDWCATVYSTSDGKGLHFSLSHHDAQGESYYLTPISRGTYYKLR